ncbi:MAG: SH3 domain-containing protein [Gammaproteobacteria bacterium]|nr:SH3 domain-containing protein [Gammaproteobacteria bacterium]
MAARALVPLLFCLILLLSHGAQGAAVQAMVAEPFMELHTGPGRGYPVFHVLDRGEHFEILARRTDWFRVRGQREHVGWVSLAQMRLATAADGRPLQLEGADATEYSQRRWESGVMLGDFGGGDVISLYGNYLLTRNLSVELAGSTITGSFSDAWMASAHLLHQPFPEWRVSPFVSLGTGVIWIRPQARLAETERRRDQVASVGLGLRMHLTRRFMLRAEYRSHLIFTDRNENEVVDEWKAGFAFFF